MSYITLYVDTGQVETTPVNMVPDTTGFNALRYCMHAVGLGDENPEEFELTSQDDYGAKIPADELIYPYHGCIVQIAFRMVGVGYDENQVRRLLEW